MEREVKVVFETDLNNVEVGKTLYDQFTNEVEALLENTVETVSDTQCLDHYLDTEHLDLFKTGRLFRVRVMFSNRIITVELTIKKNTKEENGVTTREEINQSYSWKEFKENFMELTKAYFEEHFPEFKDSKVDFKMGVLSKNNISTYLNDKLNVEIKCEEYEFAYMDSFIDNVWFGLEIEAKNDTEESINVIKIVGEKTQNYSEIMKPAKSKYSTGIELFLKGDSQFLIEDSYSNYIKAIDSIMEELKNV